MFRVCPSTTPSEACFGNSFLTAEGNPSGGENPVNGKRYWYINFNAARWLSNEVYTSQWRLPRGVSCANGCILQWSWAAYQNCALPCENASIDDTRRVSVPCTSTLHGWYALLASALDLRRPTACAVPCRACSVAWTSVATDRYAPALRLSGLR